MNLVSLCLIVIAVGCTDGSKWVKLPPIRKHSNFDNITLSYEDFDNDESFARFSGINDTTYKIFSTESTLLNDDHIISDIKQVSKDFSTVNFSSKSKATTVPNNLKTSSIGNIFDSTIISSLLSQLQKNLFSKVPTALQEKALFLKKIHDNILIHIDEKFNSLWTNSGGAEGRGFKENDHHLEFPSAESALMTISFLTFAVYLIKLILQVINILKTKKMMITPMVTSAGRDFIKYNSDINFHDDMNMQIVRLMKSFDSI